MPKPMKQSASKGIGSVDASKYGPLYAEHALRIFEVYEKSAHGISDRRQIANSFYLTVCTTLIGYLVLLSDETVQKPTLIVAGLAICLLWHRAIRAYKGINAAKFKVIHKMEDELPFRAYQHEWELLESGENRAVHRPFSDIEGLVPFVFLILLCIMLVPAAMKLLGGVLPFVKCLFP